jgi:8-oxo-dGTP diphosphatase
MIDVVCGVVNHNHKILITQRGDDKNYGKWEFPGGKVKKKEKPFDSIKRELFEELGLTVKPIKEIIRYSYKKFNLIFILCKPLNPNEIQLTEHLDYFWIDKTEFSKFQFLEGDISFIQNYLLNK